MIPPYVSNYNAERMLVHYENRMKYVRLPVGGLKYVIAIARHVRKVIRRGR